MSDISNGPSNFLKNMKRSTNFMISFAFSSLCSFIYSKRILFNKEYHGHFNSPQNIYNKNMNHFYLKEVFARFAMGFLFVSSALTLAKYYTGGYDMTNIDVEKEDKAQRSLGNNKKFSFDDRVNQDYVQRELDMSKYSQDLIRRRDMVNKYLNDK